MGVVILLTVLTNFSNPGFPNPFLELFPQFREFLLRQQASVAYAATLSLISVLPILLAVWIAADYLKRESDEFIRMLVVRALLWGFAITMAGDAIVGVVTTVYSRPFPIALLNVDLFFASALIAFRLLRQGYQ
jgi:threonine/homoserine/homoserine lactone efflux protein